MGSWKFYEERDPHYKHNVEFKFNAPVTTKQFDSILDHFRQNAITTSGIRVGIEYELRQKSSYSVRGVLEEYLDGAIPAATKGQQVEGAGWFDIYKGTNESDHAPRSDFTLLLEGFGDGIKVLGVAVSQQFLSSADVLLKKDTFSDGLLGLLGNAYEHVVVFEKKVVIGK